MLGKYRQLTNLYKREIPLYSLLNSGLHYSVLCLIQLCLHSMIIVFSSKHKYTAVVIKNRPVPMVDQALLVDLLVYGEYGNVHVLLSVGETVQVLTMPTKGQKRAQEPENGVGNRPTKCRA